MTTHLLDSDVWLAAVNADEREHEPARHLVERAITPEQALVTG